MRNLLARYKKLPIRLQLLLLAITTLMTVLFIILFNFSRVSNIFISKNDRYMKAVMTQIKQSVIDNSNTLNNILTSIAYNSMVQEYLIEDDPVDKYELNLKVTNLLTNMIGLKDGVIDIILLREDKSTYYLNGDILNVEELKVALPVMGQIYYTEIRTLDFNYGTADCFIAGTRIYSVIPETEYGTPIGTLLAIVNKDCLIW